MKYRVAYVTIVFILTAFTTPIFSIDDSLLVIIPQPEEIEEAYHSDLIDYTDYTILLEIVEKAELSRADSLVLLSFPDLLMSLSTDLDNSVVVGSSDEQADTIPQSHPIHFKTLLRNNYRLRELSQRNYLLRCDLVTGGWAANFDFKRNYGGTTGWNRRNLSYLSPDNTLHAVLGSFSTRFGMGVIYGYHGRLLSRESDREEVEEYLFPTYGGGNGIQIDWKNNSLVMDWDRNAEFTSQFIGVNANIHNAFFVTGGWGRIANRQSQSSGSAEYISLAGEIPCLDKTQFEAAVALWKDKLYPAFVLRNRFSKGRYKSELTVWHYNKQYPSFFAGSISSRRSRTRDIAALDFSYSNRRAGETGLLTRTSYRITPITTAVFKSSYSYRSSIMNRIEAEVALKQKLGGDYHLGLTAFYRRDSLISDEDIEKKAQIDIVRSSNSMRTRLAVRYRFDVHHKYDYYTIYLENKLVNVIGSLYIVYKLDKLYLSDMRNNYSYVACSFEGRIAEGVNSTVKYSYRYNRGNLEHYGTIRWDILWDI